MPVILSPRQKQIKEMLDLGIRQVHIADALELTQAYVYQVKERIKAIEGPPKSQEKTK